MTGTGQRVRRKLHLPAAQHAAEQVVWRDAEAGAGHFHPRLQAAALHHLCGCAPALTDIHMVLIFSRCCWLAACVLRLMANSLHATMLIVLPGNPWHHILA